VREEGLAAWQERRTRTSYLPKRQNHENVAGSIVKKPQKARVEKVRGVPFISHGKKEMPVKVKWVKGVKTNTGKGEYCPQPTNP